MGRYSRPLDLRDHAQCQNLLTSAQSGLQSVVALLQDCIIRRDLTSRQYDGTLIINLPQLLHVKMELSMCGQDQAWYVNATQQNHSTKRQQSRIARRVRCCYIHVLYAHLRFRTFISDRDRPLDSRNMLHGLSTMTRVYLHNRTQARLTFFKERPQRHKLP
jgi:hypothetical protein